MRSRHMISCNKIYTIKEYESFTKEKCVDGYTALPEDTFNTLENFILTNLKLDEKSSDPIELLSISARKSIGKIITAQNYVGVLSLCDGTVIEILPKVTNNKISIDKVRKIFLTMLKYLQNINFKKYDISKLQTDKFNIFEIFV